MTHERERVAQAVEGMDTSTVEGARETADAAIAAMGDRADASQQLAEARAQVHRLCGAGEQFAAFMHPNDDDARGAHMREYRKWVKAKTEAWESIKETRDDK